MQQNWNSMLEGVAEAGHKAVAAAAELNKIATRTQGALVRKQIATLETCLDTGTQYLKVAADVRDPKEVMKRNTELAVALGEKLVAATQETLEIQVQARDELARWFEDGMNVAKAEAEAAMKNGGAPRKTAARSSAKKSA